MPPQNQAEQSAQKPALDFSHIPGWQQIDGDLQARTQAQAQAALPQPKITPPWENEPELPAGPPTTKLGKAYDAAKSWLSEHEQNLSEKVLAPFRTGLDRMSEDLQQAGESGHTASGGQLTGPTRALASGVGSLLKQVPIGRNVKETALMALTPPEFPEAKGISRELKAGEKSAAKLDFSHIPGHAEVSAEKAERRAGVGGYSGDSPTESQFVQKVIQGEKNTETWAPADMGDGGKAWLDKTGKYIPQDKEHQDIPGNFWNRSIRIGNLEKKGPLLVHAEGAPSEAQRKAIAADIKKQGGAIYDLKKDGNNVTGEAKTVGDFLRAIDSTWKPETSLAPKQSLADRLFSEALAKPQGGHAGGGVASVEELSRPGRFVKISKSGMPTDQGKVPDFNLKAGEAGYQVKPDGMWELKAGQETNATKLGVQNYAREVFKKR